MARDSGRLDVSYYASVDKEADDLTQVWSQTEERLPQGWQLDGLRCASTGLGTEDRSEDWVAVAVSPTGEERAFRAGDPVAALAGLADSFG